MGQLDAAIRRVWREPRPLAFLASRLFWKTGLCRMFVIRRGTYRLHFFPTSYSANLWVYPESEQAKNNFYKAYLRTRDTIVDVGANIGFTTFDAAVLVPDGMVLAFEPHPVIFRYLSANLQLNGFSNVRLFNVGLGAAESVDRMTDLRADDQNRIDPDGRLEVQILALDSVLDELDGPVALLKLDVEGFEKFVMEGAGRTLGRTQCLLFESNEARYQSMGYSTRDVLALLVDYGMIPFKLDPRTREFQRLSLSYRSLKNEKLFAVSDPILLQSRVGETYRVTRLTGC